MRITHVIDYFHTDVGYQEFFLAREQALAGHQVTVISTHHRHHTVAVPGPDEALGLAELHDAGVALVRLPARQLGHDRTWISGLRDAVRASRPDAIHVHGAFAPTTLRAVRAGRAAGAGILVDTHIYDDGAPGAQSALNRAVYATYRRTAGAVLRRQVATWVSNGPLETAFLVSRLGVAERDVLAVPLGFDPAVFGWEPTRRVRGRAAVGATDEHAVVAVTGKLHPGKRPELVAAACETLARARPVRLVVAGTITPESRRAVHDAAPGLAATGSLVERPMLGRGDLADLYHAADAVVFAGNPSISIYEAAGTGARTLVIPNAFGHWLAGQCSTVEPIVTDDLDLASLVPLDARTRADRAAAAATAFAWPHVAERFVDLYRALPRSTPDR